MSNKDKKRSIELVENRKSQSVFGKSYLFGIGINEYSEFPNLRNAVKDVQDFIAVLEEKYELNQVFTLFDKEATRDNIIETLDHLSRFLKKGDKLIIYYSGHGHLNLQKRGFWIPYDAKEGVTSRYIANSRIRDYLGDIPATHTLLISDSCFSGSMLVRSTGIGSSKAVEELEQIPSRWALCSGRHDEEVADGPPGENSPFAASIMDELKHNKKGSLNIGLLANNVIEKTRYKYDQLPEGCPIQGVGHEGGQYIFRLKANEAADWVACKSEGTLAAYQAFLLKYPESKHSVEAQKKVNVLEEEAVWEKAKEANTILSYYKYDRQYPDGRYVKESLTAIQELEEEQAWEEAVAKNTLSGYRRYTMIYRDGKYVQDAKDRIEGLIAVREEPLLWDEATGKNTEVAYESYLEKYPDGRFASEARLRLKEIQKAVEEKQAEAAHQKKEREAATAREKVQRENTEAAREERAKEEATAWEKAKAKNSEAAYSAFLQQYPESEHVIKAKAEVKKIKEEKNRLEKERKAEEREADRKKSEQQETRDWEKATQGNSIAAFKTYLKKHPAGKNTKAAQTRLNELQAKQRQVQIAQLKKWAPRLAPLLLIPFIIWGISVLNKKSGGTSDNQILGPSPTITHSISWDELTLTIAEGTPPFTLKLLKGSQELYKEEIDAHGSERVKLSGIIQATGNYEVEVTDSMDQKVIETINIDPSQFKFNSIIHDEQSYKIVRLNGQIWLADNLNIKVDKSLCYNNEEANCEKYGRLYKWEVAQGACKKLGPDWHLPTDREWRELAKVYGGADDDAKDGGKAAYKALINGGVSGFSALLGGGNIGSLGYKFSDIDKVGYYWSATTNKGYDDHAARFAFVSQTGELFRVGSDAKFHFYSCRCVKDDIPDSSGQVPSMTPSFKGDELTVTIDEGTPPFTLRLLRKGKEQYKKEMNAAESEKISLSEFRKDPGKYEIELTDAAGQKVSKTIDIDPPKTNYITDKRNDYKTIKLKGQTWLGENLNLKVKDSWCYGNKDSNCEKYGRLYLWSAAKEACQKLGSGWRLPTNDEWVSMAKYAGTGYVGRDRENAIYKVLIKGGQSGFDALLGGRRWSEGVYNLLEEDGYYWSATEENEREAALLKFESGKLLQFTYYKNMGYSCRCVKDD